MVKKHKKQPSWQEHLKYHIILCSFALRFVWHTFAHLSKVFHSWAYFFLPILPLHSFAYHCILLNSNVYLFIFVHTFKKVFHTFKKLCHIVHTIAYFSLHCIVLHTIHTFSYLSLLFPTFIYFCITLHKCGYFWTLLLTFA